MIEATAELKEERVHAAVHGVSELIKGNVDSDSMQEVRSTAPLHPPTSAGVRTHAGALTHVQQQKNHAHTRTHKHTHAHTNTQTHKHTVDGSLQ